MNTDEREQIEKVLSTIKQDEWADFLEREGVELNARLNAVRGALRGSGKLSGRAPPRPISEVIALLGHRLLSDRTTGPWLRERILRNLPPTKYEKLETRYRDVKATRANRLHGNMAQQGKGASVMANYWHQGSTWALQFCEVVGLPEFLATRQANALPKDEEIMPVEPLPPLHDFQVEVYAAGMAKFHVAEKRLEAFLDPSELSELSQASLRRPLGDFQYLPSVPSLTPRRLPISPKRPFVDPSEIPDRFTTSAVTTRETRDRDHVRSHPPRPLQHPHPRMHRFRRLP